MVINSVPLNRVSVPWISSSAFPIKAHVSALGVGSLPLRNLYSALSVLGLTYTFTPDPTPKRKQNQDLSAVSVVSSAATPLYNTHLQQEPSVRSLPRVIITAASTADYISLREGLVALSPLERLSGSGPLSKGIATETIPPGQSGVIIAT